MASFLTSRQVAEKLDMTVHEFYRARPVLTELHGFPEPLAGFRTPHRYNAHAVICWIANFKAGQTLATPGKSPAQDEIAAMMARVGGAPNVHLLRLAAQPH